MSKKHLALLFLCSLVPWTVGYGLLPLLPLYAAHLGAATGGAGLSLSVVYAALTSGTLIAGWLSDRLQARKPLLLLSGLLGIPAMWLVGRATTIGHLTVLTSMVYFLGGMGLALLTIIAGLLAGPAERGRVFGVLGLSGPVALVLGGLASGPIADRWGYPVLFSVSAAFTAS